MDGKATNDQGNLYWELLDMLGRYREEIIKIGFASPEKESLKKPCVTERDLIDAIDSIMYSSLELNRILEVCPDSIYVVDRNGITLRTNQAFVHTTGVSRDEVIGNSVYELEKVGYFRPSVNGIALREKRQVSIVQMGKNTKETVATAVPFFDAAGALQGSVSNAKLLQEINGIMNYVKDTKQEFDSPQLLENETIIFESAAMREINDLARAVADVDSSILISGETGVGKSMLTRYIHMNGRRKHHRLIEINCGAIPETLLESELFGYESGAFTGADRRGKPGLIELADKGTIFFDEINELPLSLQVKLLHFLQNKKIIRVGGTKEIDVNARIIAASNKSLEALVTKEAFRADLFYRLNVIPIHIPPLRERPEDLAVAIGYFLEKFNNRHGRQVSFEKAKIAELMAHSWPGNLRELENYIERAVVTSRQNGTPGPGPSPGGIEMRPASTDCGLSADIAARGRSLDEILDAVERQIILQSYEEHKSSYRVAEELGISQASAHRRIRKYLGEKL